VQDDHVADALDAGRGHHPLTLDRHRLGAAGPQGVRDGLDVLLVHEQLADRGQVGPRRRQLLLRGVVQGDGHPRAVHRGQPGRPLEAAHLGPVGLAADGAEVAGQPVHLPGQVGGPGPLRLQVLGLGVRETVEVVVPAGTDVAALGADHARHEEHARHQEHRGGHEPPSERPRPVGPGPLREGRRQPGAPGLAVRVGSRMLHRCPSRCLRAGGVTPTTLAESRTRSGGARMPPPSPTTEPTTAQEYPCPDPVRPAAPARPSAPRRT
jgi:hypothetical protein